MRREGKVPKTRSLHEKLRYIILTMVLAIILCMVFVIGTLWIYAYQYSKITHNVNVSSKFGINFKTDIDLKMYHFMIGSKEQTNLPVTEVEDAIVIAESLQNTTYRKESKEAIENVINYCENLKKRMYEMAKTKTYQERKTQLNNNIYVLTNLIQNRMMDYIYYEAGSMSELEAKMTRNSIESVCLAILVIILITFLMLRRCLKFSRSITDPIVKLCQNVGQVGQGEFFIPNVESDSYEINHLNDGIQRMAEKIFILIQNIKADQLLQHKTELMLLQAQINPHFLYNTLDTIIWLVESNKNEDAVQMISELAIFFRTMVSKGEDVITLKDELEHTKSYLSIQQARYRDILEFSIDCPEGVLNCSIPKLTLQPLVENALYHGVKEKRGKSSIKVICTVKDDTIYITVEDTGNGMSPNRLQEVRNAMNTDDKTGFGLKAVDERIKLYYGEAYNLQIDSIEGMGTTVRICIPEKNEPFS
ncbi:two-component sensor kinase YesM [Lachnospiraceae bacterium KM106-2]|nr:two-component sensor kinase YesM [Lachnospiraceae bacterium KM106-2]